jgi:hypothetical protein
MSRQKKSFEKAFRAIVSIFKKEKTNHITIQRKYLPEIVTQDLLELSKADGLPVIKSFYIEFFEINGFKVLFDANEAHFNLIYENLNKLKDNPVKILTCKKCLAKDTIKTRGGYICRNCGYVIKLG